MAYKKHAKAVGIIEIVLQVFYTVGVAVSFVRLIPLTNAPEDASYKMFYYEDSTGKWASYNATDPIFGIIIAILVILVCYWILNNWLVYLVFTGGRQHREYRLKVWYIVQVVIVALIILGTIMQLGMGQITVQLIVNVLYVVYRIYSIRVVRGYVSELGVGSPNP